MAAPIQTIGGPEGQEAQEERQQCQQHGGRRSTDHEPDPGQDALGQGGADHAVDHALHRRFDDVDQVLAVIAADSLEALPQTHHETLTVSI